MKYPFLLNILLHTCISFFHLSFSLNEFLFLGGGGVSFVFDVQLKPLKFFSFSLLVKKYDESCSTYDDSGICGAPNSECVDGKCRCKNNFKPMWGGEFCGDPESLMPTETALSGDTCPRGLGVTRSGAASYLPFQIMDHAPPSCACSPGTHTGLPNSFDDTSGYFLGKKRPMCVSGKQ